MEDTYFFGEDGKNSLDNDHPKNLRCKTISLFFCLVLVRKPIINQWRMQVIFPKLRSILIEPNINCIDVDGERDALSGREQETLSSHFNQGLLSWAKLTNNSFVPLLYLLVRIAPPKC